MTVLNMHIVGIIKKIHKYRYEMVKAVSNSQSKVSNPDFIRFKSFIADFRGYVKQVVSTPEVDAPKASPKEYILPVAELLPEVDNDSISEMRRYWDLLEEEVSKCGSNSRAAGLSKFDHKRIVDMIDRIERFMDEYVAELAEVDFTESIPFHKVSGEGRSSDVGGTNLP